jgi:hypothetical protein
MDGWTAGEDMYMAIWRGEMEWDPQPDDEARLSEWEEPDEAEAQPEPEFLTAKPRFMKMTSRERARARLGSRAGCVICQGEECWCAVVERLCELACGHGVGTGICRACLAELLLISERGSARGADFQARRLVAASRLRRRRGAA